MEQVIWVNDNDEVLGQVSLARSHQEGLLHRVAAIYLINNKDQILLQKRADGGPLGGRLDHSAAGHVDVNETFLQAAQRELLEELGVNNQQLRFIGNCTSNEAKGRIRHFFAVYECQDNPQKLDPQEVTEVFWEDPQKVWEEMQSDNDNFKYTGGFKSTLELYLRSKASIK